MFHICVIRELPITASINANQSFSGILFLNNNPKIIVVRIGFNVVTKTPPVEA